MEPILIYQEKSETIRQMPENYLIAHKENGRWLCEPDLAANKEICVRVFKALMEYENKYGDGLNLLSKVTPNHKFTNENEDIEDIEEIRKEVLKLDNIMQLGPFFRFIDYCNELATTGFSTKEKLIENMNTIRFDSETVLYMKERYLTLKLSAVI